MASFGGFLRSLFFKDYSKDYEDEIRGQYADGNYLYDENGKPFSQDEALAGVPNNNEYSLSNLLGNGGLLGALVSYLNSKTGNALTGAQREQNVFNAEQAAIQRGYEERLSNTAYQRGVVDMQNAGLNPALMYGNGAAAVSPSGAVASGSSPSASTFSLMSILMDYKLRNRQLDIEQQNADTNQIAVEKENESKDKALSWYDRIQQVKIDLDKSLTTLNDEQRENVIKQRDLILKQMDKMISEIHNIDAERLLHEQQAEYFKMSAFEIGKMLPYNIALSQARTDHEQAAAFLDWAYQSKEMKLLNSDYYDYIIEKAFEDKNVSKYNAQQSAYDYILHSGQHIKSKFGKSLFHGLQNFGTAISGLGPIFGLATGLAVGRVTKPSVQPPVTTMKHNWSTGERIFSTQYFH